MQNFKFLSKKGMFERVQTLFVMKSSFLKIFCVYKNHFLCTSSWLTEMAPDTSGKRRGKFLISYLFKCLYDYPLTLCEEKIV